MTNERNPTYEIWGADTDTDGDLASHSVFREDCFSFDEAVEAVKEWQTNGRAAWIQGKETGNVIQVV